jgi:hypothetical protein
MIAVVRPFLRSGTTAAAVIVVVVIVKREPEWLG